MYGPGYRPYEPQFEPQKVADNLWIVNGPEVGYRYAGLTLPCPTRMTVVRIGRKLWLHSPICLVPMLLDRLAALGDVAWIVVPNSFHHAHAAAWAERYPAAECHLSPDLASRFEATLGDAELLDNVTPEAWLPDLEQLQVNLGSFIETVFFHRPSATLIVTDLVQNFEAGRIRNPATRLILWAGGSTGPNGKTSVDIRLPARRHHDRMRRAAAQMLQWLPQRIILSHGKCYDTEIAEELRRAFRWAT